MRSVIIAVAIAVTRFGLASAQGNDVDTAKADQIFEQAQQLKRQGDTVDACKKYDESLRYNRNAIGTLLNVALCNEQAGKFATALEYFTLARDLAREHSFTEHLKAAEEHVAKNQPLVPHLAISFAEIVPETRLVIDDKVHALDAAGDIGLDPGNHRVAVSAPGRVTYETMVTLERGKPKAIAVPRLGYPVTVKNTRRTIGKIVTFSGVALVGTGVVLGAVASKMYRDEFDAGHCSDATDPPGCSSEGFLATDKARTLGDVGTAVGIVGGVAIGVGAYLWLFAPKEPSDHVAIVPTIDGHSASVSALGRF